MKRTSKPQKPTRENQQKKIRALEKTTHDCEQTDKVAQSPKQSLRLLGELELLLENSLVGILVVQNRHITRINKRGLDILGYAAPELIGKHADLIHVSRESSDYFGKNYYQATAHKEIPNIEYPLKRKDGRQIWCNISGKTLSPPDLSKGVIWVFEDIDSRKRMEKRLRESEKTYRSIFEYTGSATIIIENDMTISMANTRFEELSGYAGIEVEGKKSLADFVAGQDLDRIKQYHAARRNKKQATPSLYEFRFVDRQGNRKNILAEVGIIPETAKSIASFVDITPRKQMEEKLKGRLIFEKMLSEISSRAILTKEPVKFQKECLKTMGQALNVSRIYIFNYCHETDTMDNTFEWVGPGTAPEKPRFQKIPAITMPWWNNRLKSGRIINYRDINDIPGKEEKAILQARNTRSVVVVPLFIRKGYYGFMGLEECRSPRSWSDQDVNNLKTVGQIVTGFIERHSAEQALRDRELELETQSHHLKEVNTALKILLRQRDRDKKEFEKNILKNLKELVTPSLETLKKSRLTPDQQNNLKILETNLKEITSPFANTLSAVYLVFTPKEIQIANLIRQGKTTKETAELLKSSIRSIEFHRNNIRKKLGLTHKQTNLRSYLLSLNEHEPPSC